MYYYEFHIVVLIQYNFLLDFHPHFEYFLTDIKSQFNFDLNFHENEILVFKFLT